MSVKPNVVEYAGGVIMNLLFPKRCPVCGDVVRPEDGKVCRECRGIFTRVGEPKCLRCGKPIDRGECEYCTDCGKKASHFEKNRSLWVYDAVTRRSIAEYKYKRRREYSDYYVEEADKWLGGYIRSSGVDAFVPVPLHKSKLRARGFNQAEWLARGMGERTGIPVLTDALVRNKWTTPQKELDEKERAKNLEGAFAICTSHADGLRGMDAVMLVDDIYTSGSTMNACAKALRDAGVGKAYAMTLCIGKGY